MLIALGSNVTSQFGPPESTISAALKALENRGALIRAVSRYFSTPAFPEGNGPDFINAAADLDAPWDPATALSQLHEVEAEFGRQRDVRWGARTLDLDLIAMDDLVCPDPHTHKIWREMPLDQQMRMTPTELILPHPRMQDRAFVLVPLCDIAPDWQHPAHGASVQQMCDALPQTLRDEVRPLQ